MIVAGNESLMREVYLEIHRNSEARWVEAIGKDDDDERSMAIQALFQSTRKGDLAQILAEKIENGAAFLVPGYLQTAIEEIVK